MADTNPCQPLMPDKPNVLLICVDHWSGMLLEQAGHPTILAPTIAQLARNGVHFSNAYSACPVCVPARRGIMTGLTPRGHGDRYFGRPPEMPGVTTLAQAFRNAGYQAQAVGKLHVTPQRDRIGFDEVILMEEGRRPKACDRADDWEMYVAERGFAGQQYASGMAQNDYLTRTWHLPEDCHPTNFCAWQMCKTIQRRDPRKPGFWYMSFVGPHPPVWPLQAYMDLYRDIPMDEPHIGGWAQRFEDLPYALQFRSSRYSILRSPAHAVEMARRAFYATVTHIDHQIRTVIGYLSEEKLIDNTIIAFTSDHGDMLGNHRLWAKGLFYDPSAKVPFVVMPAAKDTRMKVGVPDDRLVELCDMMPTLLDLAGLPIPGHVEGQSLVGPQRREELYGEYQTSPECSRMIRDQRFKLIYYPTGNRFQLFDMVSDPHETRDLSSDAHYAEHRERLSQRLMTYLWGEDLEWVKDGKLVGWPHKAYEPKPHRELSGQRGWRFIE